MADREGLSYEQARDELTNVVKRLEAGGLSLEQSLELWERGEKLAAICGEWLEGARARLTAAIAAREGAQAPDAQAPDAQEPDAQEGQNRRNGGETPF